MLTILPALLLGGMGVAAAFVAVGAGSAVLYAMGQRCTDCPIDRSGQFTWIFLSYAVVLVVIAVIHLLLAYRIWRGGEWAAVAGMVLSGIGLVVLLLLWSPTAVLVGAGGVLAYGVALVTLVASRLRPLETA